MLILYVLSVISFAALVWAAMSISRHIRRNQALASPATALDDPQAPAKRRSDGSPDRRLPHPGRHAA